MRTQGDEDLGPMIGAVYGCEAVWDAARASLGARMVWGYFFRRGFQIPPDYVVTHPCLRNPLDVSTRGAHHVSSAPRTTDREMRHGADRQTQTPKPHPHRRLSRSGYLLAAPGQWQGVHRVRASLHPLHWFPTPSQIDL